jgi:putative tryptophan/tyrosine transport system substrate-binding protein
MRRREFITALGGAAATAAWPLTAHAQKSMAVVGFLNSGLPGPFAPLVQLFRVGLGQIGYFEGQNLAIEYRWAQGQYDQLAGLAAELASRQVSVIVTTDDVSSALAAKAATSTIPIVFAIGGNPVEFGLVTNLNRPSGSITGCSGRDARFTARPPPRSVRAAFPHTAPASGV